MPSRDPNTEELVRRASTGDTSAMQRLMNRHRSRLGRMIAVRMDSRLAARLDPSDVVQDALLEASRKLPEYARDPCLPFYPWLRQIAWERLVEIHRQHLRAQKRSVAREEPPAMELSDQSAVDLAGRLMSSGTSPSGRFLREEIRQRVRHALDQLHPADREVLIMRHLEQLHLSEIAAILGVTEAAVKMRRLRGIRRLQRILGDDFAGGSR